MGTIFIDDGNLEEAIIPLKTHASILQKNICCPLNSLQIYLGLTLTDLISIILLFYCSCQLLQKQIGDRF